MIKRFLLFFLIASSVAKAATITADVGGGNWSNTATWVGAATPTAADDVVLANTSGSVTVDTGTCVSKSVTATAYLSTLNFSAGTTLTVSGNVQFNSLAGGMTLVGTGVMAINATANLLSNGQVFPGSIYLPTNTTSTLADSWTISHDLTVLTTATFSGNAVTIGGSCTNTTGFGGTTTITLNGSGNYSGITSKTTTINTSGSITIGNMTRSSNTLTYVSGTIVNTGSTLTWQGGTLSTGTMHWNNITIPLAGLGNSTFTIGSQLIADGALSITGAGSSGLTITWSGAFNVTLNELDVEARGASIFPAGVTLTVNSKLFSWGAPSTSARYAFSSGTASSPIYLKFLGSCANSQIFNTNFVDVDASPSSSPVTDYGNSTLTRTTNIIAGTFTNQNCSSSSPKGFF